MVARMLGAAPVLADAVVEALSASSDPANSSSRPPGAETEQQAEALSATVWHAIWPVERCCQPGTRGLDVLVWWLRPVKCGFRGLKAGTSP